MPYNEVPSSPSAHVHYFSFLGSVSPFSYYSVFTLDFVLGSTSLDAHSTSGALCLRALSRDLFPPVCTNSNNPTFDGYSTILPNKSHFTFCSGSRLRTLYLCVFLFWFVRFICFLTILLSVVAVGPSAPSSLKSCLDK